MSKIDLYDPKWIEMVFEGKNKEYGAYKLRRGTSSRNIKALLILLIAAALIGGYLVYKIQADKAAAAVTGLEKDIASAEKKIADKREEIKKYEQKIKDCEKEIADLEKSIGKYNDKKSAAEKKVDEANQNVRAVEGEVEKYRQMSE